MFNTKKDKRTEAERLVDEQILILADLAQSPEELNDVIELMRLREAPKERKFKVSPDTLVVAATNLAGILLILNYEKLGVVTSKALGFVIKGRV